MAERIDFWLDLDREAIDADQPRRLYLRVRWRAPAGDGIPRRRPLNLGVALDKSGSMAGAKIEVAKGALSLLVRELAAGDIVTIVTFDDWADVVVKAQPVGNRTGLFAKIAGISAGASTDLSAGWLAAIDQMRSFVGEGRSSRVLILSDGHANAGIVEGDRLATMARQFRLEGMETSTLGFGDGFNEDLMQELATAGDGRFHYVETADVAGKVFEAELGGLLSLHAQNFTVSVEWADTVRRGSLVNEMTHQTGERALEVRVGNTCKGDERALLFSFDIPVLDLLGVAPVAKVRVEYDLVGDLSHQVHEYSVDVTLVKDANDPRCQPRVEVREQVVGLFAARARRSALRQADQGDFAGAREILRSFRNAQEPWASKSVTVMRELDLLAKDEERLKNQEDYASTRKSMSTISYITSQSMSVRQDLLPSRYQTGESSLPTPATPPPEANPPDPRPASTMASLVIGGVRFPLVRSISTLGTAAGCDITLALAGPADLHAVIVRDAVSFWIVSWKSPHSLEVGGEIREAVELLDGDVARLGVVGMTFEVEADHRPPGPRRFLTERAGWLEPLRQMLAGAVTPLDGPAPGGEVSLERALLLLAHLTGADRVAWLSGDAPPAPFQVSREVRLQDGHVVSLREPLEGPTDRASVGLPSPRTVRFVTGPDGQWTRESIPGEAGPGRYALVMPLLAGNRRHGAFRFLWNMAPKMDFPRAPGYRLSCLEAVSAVAVRHLWSALVAGRGIGGLRPGPRDERDPGAVLTDGTTIVPLIDPVLVIGRRSKGDLGASWVQREEGVSAAHALLVRKRTLDGHRVLDMRSRTGVIVSGERKHRGDLVEGSTLDVGGTRWTYHAVSGPSEGTSVMEAWRLLAARDAQRLGVLQARLAELPALLDELDGAVGGDGRARVIVARLERLIPRCHAWIRLPDGRIVAGPEAATGDGLDPATLARAVIEAMSTAGERSGWDSAHRLRGEDVGPSDGGRVLMAPLPLGREITGQLVLYTPREDTLLEEFDASLPGILGLFLELAG